MTTVWQEPADLIRSPLKRPRLRYLVFGGFDNFVVDEIPNVQ
jgi:hypothetical protein